MVRRTRLGIFFFGLALIAGFLFLPRAEAAFGISPPFINADHLVRGAKYTQTVYLVQDQPNEDLPIKVRLDISDRARSWVTVEPGFDFSIPQGTHQFPVKVTIQVPPDIDLGLYQGRINFTSAPNQTGQVTIALGAEAVINLTVGNDVYRKIAVPIIRVLDIEDNWSPKVYVKFENEGNIPEGFTGATFELLDRFNAVRLAYVQKTDRFPETNPFSTSEYTMEFPIGFRLGVGEYWANVAFYQNDTLVASQKAVFNVLPAGSISGFRGWFSSYVGDHPRTAAGIFGGGIVFLGVVIAFRRRRRR